VTKDGRWPLAIPARGVAPPPGLCHLWLARLPPGGSWPGLPCLLDAAERERAGRLRSQAAREAFTASRTAQRLVLARYLACPPRAVPISRTCRHCGADHGRPRVEGANVDFSVSHSGRWLVIAVTGGGVLVGADLEVPPRPLLEGLADRVLTAAERTALAQVPQPGRAGWLLRAWTRKEAVAKLSGHGMAAPFSRIDVRGAVAIVERPPAGWPAGRIHLADVPAGRARLLALATTAPVTGIVRCGPLGRLVHLDRRAEGHGRDAAATGAEATGRG